MSSTDSKNSNKRKRNKKTGGEADSPLKKAKQDITHVQIDNMTVAALKEHLTTLGARKGGNKRVLVSRLKDLVPDTGEKKNEKKAEQSNKSETTKPKQTPSKKKPSKKKPTTQNRDTKQNTKTKTNTPGKSGKKPAGKKPTQQTQPPNKAKEAQTSKKATKAAPKKTAQQKTQRTQQPPKQRQTKQAPTASKTSVATEQSSVFGPDFDARTCSRLQSMGVSSITELYEYSRIDPYWVSALALTPRQALSVSRGPSVVPAPSTVGEAVKNAPERQEQVRKTSTVAGKKRARSNSRKSSQKHTGKHKHRGAKTSHKGKQNTSKKGGRNKPKAQSVKQAKAPSTAANTDSQPAQLSDTSVLKYCSSPEPTPTKKKRRKKSRRKSTSAPAVDTQE